MKPELLNGYKENAAGHLVPIDNIDEIDLLRDQLVLDTLTKALALREQLEAFKRAAHDDIQAFIGLSMERYGVQVGGKKGNVCLLSYDGKTKLDVAISDSLRFDERLGAAKQLIDQCIHRWAEGGNSNIRALIDHAFQVDKAGRINTSRVLGLLKLKIDDDDWRGAMDALRDSITIASTKSYLRLYQRSGPEDKWRQVCLDLAAL